MHRVLRGASAVLGRGDGVPSQPLPLRVGLWRRGVEGEVALLRAGGAELRRGDRGRGARGCDPTQAALPRRRRRPLRLRPRGLRSRCAVPHCNPLFFFSLRNSLQTLVTLGSGEVFFASGVCDSVSLSPGLFALQVHMCCQGMYSSPEPWMS
jgi:hypothetical protein